MSPASDIPTSAPRRSGKPSGLALHRGVHTGDTPPLKYIIGSYLLCFVVAGTMAGVLYQSRIENDTIFFWVLFLSVSIWFGSHDIEPQVKRWFTASAHQSIAVFLANVFVYVVGFACVLALYWLSDRHPGWFFIALLCGAVWWGTARGHAMVKWLSN